MTHLHICLTDLPGQLIRWQKAFPFGRIISRIEDVTPFSNADPMVWLHVDTLDDEALGRAVSWLRQKAPEARSVALTSQPDPSRTMHLLQLGMRGCCHTLSAPELFKRVAKVTSNGGYWLGEDLLTRMIQSVPVDLSPSVATDKTDPLAGLSDREREVATQVGRGASNRDIAEKLGISEKTVKAHLSAIFQKLDVRDRLQLALLVRSSKH
ncbi:MAG: hypothetical protein Tsb0017_21340 [Geothermobacteraceae bacterium]